MLITVVTPEQSFFEQECQGVILPGVSGELEILPGHATMLSELKAGLVTIKNRGKEIIFDIDHGYAEISCDRVNLLCEKARLV